MSIIDSGDTGGGDLGGTLDGLQSKTDGLVISANSFASAMAKAFTQATSGGKQFDDVLKSLVLQLSNLAVSQAIKPLVTDIASGLGDFFGGTSSLAAQVGAVSESGAGAAGSALGASVATSTSAASNVTVQIATPDAASFRRSEAYVTGQIARAVTRGQRGM